VLGANGSGKSTLVKLANGMLLPQAGAVTIDGIDTTENVGRRASDATLPDPDGAREPHDIRQLVGVVFQHPDDQIVATSVEDDVAFGPENLGLPRPEIRRRVDSSLALVGLTGLEHREPHLLSGGQKQRLVIAGALAMQPRYLVFDEPTSMLDPHGRAEVISVIARLKHDGHGVLLVTHDLAEAGRADRVVVLRLGSVVFEGTPDELFARGDLDQWGLERPPIVSLAQGLRDAGITVPPGAVDPVQIAGALCR